MEPELPDLCPLEPEPLLKALSPVRNLGHAVNHLATCKTDRLACAPSCPSVIARLAARRGVRW